MQELPEANARMRFIAAVALLAACQTAYGQSPSVSSHSVGRMDISMHEILQSGWIHAVSSAHEDNICKAPSSAGTLLDLCTPADAGV